MRSAFGVVHKSYVPRAWTDEVATGWKKARQLTSADKAKVKGDRAVTSPVNDTDSAVRRPLIERAQRKEGVLAERIAAKRKTSPVKPQSVKAGDEAWQRGYSESTGKLAPGESVSPFTYNVRSPHSEFKRR